MKPAFEQVTQGNDISELKQLVLKLPEFEPYWHFHPEYELTYIIEGRGKRIVGDSVEPFLPNDLVLLGPDLPHTWNSAKGEKGPCRAIVFQFGRNLVPDAGNGFPEFRNIARLLDLSARGLSFQGKEVNAIRRKIVALTKMSGLEKLSGFWLILNEMAAIASHSSLASHGYAPSLSKFNGERINRVFRYVTQHFAENIRLSDVAQLVHMTETSFSRFFKSLTGESFTEYLNNTRISHACALLSTQSEKSISDISTESGFNSSTHFNRMFLMKKGCTPGYFRQQYCG